MNRYGSKASSASRSEHFFHFERPRLNQLLAEAVKFPLVMVCAGAGYGKTRAVSDFVSEHKNTPVVWLQLSARDNMGSCANEGKSEVLFRVAGSLRNGLPQRSCDAFYSRWFFMRKVFRKSFSLDIRGLFFLFTNMQTAIIFHFTIRER